MEMIGQFHKSEDDLPGEQVLRRIAALTLGFGFAFAAVAMALHRPDWAKGLAGGAILGWLNFRWLRRGLRAIVNAALSQTPASVPAEVPAGSDEQPLSGAASSASAAVAIFTLLFRYALVGCGGYVIFIYLHVPLVSIGLGLCALVAAVMTASVWEVVRPKF
jgi:hypothetical protein